MQLLFILAVFSLFHFCVFAQNTIPSKCRCRPGESCYPTPAQFLAFSESLTHPLITVRPIGAPCHNPDFNPLTCDTVLTNFQNGLWRSSQPGASQYTNAEETGDGEFSCLITGVRNTTCFQGAVPLQAVNVSSISDVQKAVRFGTKHNLKIVVKSSGHGASRSMGSNGLLLWMHNLKSIEFTESFRPTPLALQGAAPRETHIAVTIGAGVQWGELYDAVSAQGYTIVGGFGAGGSVGAGGGWILGGGHSALSPRYGLGIDNVLQFSVVVADGSFLIANAEQNQDLFWALRGGGGPSFGIVTEVTYRLHPEAPLVSSYFEATTNSTESFTALLSTFHALQPSLADEGWSGFYPFTPNFLAFTYIKSNVTVSAAQSSIQPVFDQLHDLPGVSVTVSTVVSYTSFHSWYHANFENNSAGGLGYNFTQGDVVAVNGFSGSRLLPRALFESTMAIKNLSEILVQIPFGGRGFLVGGGAVAAVPPHDTATTPAWRTALIDMTIGAIYLDGTSPTSVRALEKQVSRWTSLLRNLTPGSGSYLNEPDMLDETWREDFWGNNYPRLLTIKEKYDPEDFFMAVLTVGAERWDSTVDCRL